MKVAAPRIRAHGANSYAGNISITMPDLDISIYSPQNLKIQWYIFWYEYGKRKKKIGDINHYNTFEERMAAAERLREKILRVYSPPPPPQTLQERMYAILEANKPFWRIKTHDTYKSKINVFTEWMGSKELNSENVTAFFKFLKGSRHNTTYNNYIERLTKVFREMGEEAVMEGIKKASNTTTPAMYFQKHQIPRLKKAISERDESLWLAVQLMYYCFIRPKEMRFLKAADFMLEENKILIRAEIAKNKKREFVSIPKPLRDQLGFIKYLNPSDYIFESPVHPGKPVSTNYHSRRHRKILRELGFDRRYKFYSWKHTGAVAVVKAGIHLKELQMQLRHHSLDQVNEYLRQMGISDMENLSNNFPSL